MNVVCNSSRAEVLREQLLHQRFDVLRATVVGRVGRVVRLTVADHALREEKTTQQKKKKESAGCVLIEAVGGR